MDLFGEEIKPEEPIEEIVVSDGNDPSEPEGLSHPRHMHFCIGHEGVEQALLDAFNGGRMPHGLIFSGPKGIGKATMAYRLARFLLKYGQEDEGQGSLLGAEDMIHRNLDVDYEDPTFRRVASGGHPDFMSVERAYDEGKNRYKDSVAVDDIRKVPLFLRMTSSNGGWRVVIIDDADTMNRNAQNALLKILEEPPKKTLLILVTHRLGTLIPTIRSRTQLLSFQPLSPPNLSQLLSQHSAHLMPDDLQTLTSLADGSIGKALQYMEEGALDILNMVMDQLKNHPRWDYAALHAIADDMARAGQDQAFKTFQELLIWILSQMIVAKARGQALQSAALQNEAIQSLLQNSSLEELLKICENLQSHFAKINGANLDKRQGVLGAFSLLAA